MKPFVVAYMKADGWHLVELATSEEAYARFHEHKVKGHRTALFSNVASYDGDAEALDKS